MSRHRTTLRLSAVFAAVALAKGCGERWLPYHASNAIARPSDDGHGQPAYGRADRVGFHRSVEGGGA